MILCDKEQLIVKGKSTDIGAEGVSILAFLYQKRMLVACNDCYIVGICCLFVKQPINWSEYSIEEIIKESEAFYKLKKEGTNGKV